MNSFIDQTCEQCLWCEICPCKGIACVDFTSVSDDSDHLIEENRLEYRKEYFSNYEGE